jgi:hypothetical protein
MAAGCALDQEHRVFAATGIGDNQIVADHDPTCAAACDAGYRQALLH